MSCSTTSATRKSRSVWAARSTADLPALSHDSVLVPMISMTLYRLSAMSVLPTGTAELTRSAAAAGASFHQSRRATTQQRLRPCSIASGIFDEDRAAPRYPAVKVVLDTL